MTDLLNSYEAERLPPASAPAAWPSLPGTSRALPAFPVDALPDRFGAFCRAVAECWQVPPDLAVCFALGVASAAVVGRVTVRPKHRETDYTEPAQLFLLCRAASGERKTPCLRYQSRPLEELLEERRRAVREENAAIDRELSALGREMSRAKGRTESLALEEEKAELMARRRPEPESLQSDVTPESLVQGMAEHEGRGALLSDEADSLNVMTGRSYGRDGGAVNLGPILSGYNNAPFHGRRVNRGEWHIRRACLSVCLGCQPRLLEDFMADGTGADRGLHARFLYFLPRSMIGRRKAEGDPVPEELAAWWSGVVRRLAGAEDLVIPFDPMAEDAYRAFFDEVEARLPEDLGGVLQAWAGKLCGNTVRLAGLLSLLAGEDSVSRASWDAAAWIAREYLIPHARAAFGGHDARLTDHARMLLPKLRDRERFRQSDFWRDAGRYVLGEEALEAYKTALELLARVGYIRLAADQPAPSGGRTPSPVWEVHPGLLARGGAEVEEVTL